MTLCPRQHCRTRAPSHFYPPPWDWGGQGEWAGRPYKGAPAIPPSFITPITAPPLPQSLLPGRWQQVPGG